MILPGINDYIKYEERVQSNSFKKDKGHSGSGSKSEWWKTDCFGSFYYSA